MERGVLVADPDDRERTCADVRKVELLRI